MNLEQYEHAKEIAETFSRMLLEKYERGAKEHGTLLWQHTDDELLDYAIEEAVDQAVYLLTIKLNKQKRKP